MPIYYSYTLSPLDGDSPLPIDEVLSRVTVAFPRHEFSTEAARQDAAKRLPALERVGAPEELLRVYREGKPVRCWVTDTDSEEYLQFDVWEDQGIIVQPYPKTERNAGASLISRLARVLNYQAEQEEYD